MLIGLKVYLKKQLQPRQNEDKLLRFLLSNTVNVSISVHLTAVMFVTSQTMETGSHKCPIFM